MRALLASGADINTVELGGHSPLHFATMEGHEKVVAFLLDAKCDHRLKNSGGLTAYHMIAVEDDVRACFWHTCCFS